MTSEDVLLLRKRLGLNQTEMARKLLITREYYSRIENGLLPSPRLQKELEGLMAGGENYVIKNHVPAEANTVNMVRRSKLAIKALFDSVLSAASDDPDRLAWILEQVRQHLSVPSHWKDEIDRNHPAEKEIREAVQRSRETRTDSSNTSKSA